MSLVGLDRGIFAEDEVVDEAGRSDPARNREDCAVRHVRPFGPATVGELPGYSAVTSLRFKRSRISLPGLK